MDIKAVSGGFWEASKSFLANNVGNKINLTVGNGIIILAIIIIIGIAWYIKTKKKDEKDNRIVTAQNNNEKTKQEICEGN